MSNVFDMLRKFEGGVVVETWKSGNSWYRKWSDGWVEQGGYKSAEWQEIIITFHVPFADTNYCVTAVAGNLGVHNNFNPGYYDRKTTGFTYNTMTDTASNCLWTACGYAAD